MINKISVKVKIFLTSTSKAQAKDTGMAMVLIFLLIGFITKNIVFFKITVPVLLINMIFPTVYKPIAIIWIGFSHLLGTVVSKILLSMIFFIIVTPIGLLRNIFGFDSLKLKKWKKTKSSVLTIKDHTFTSDDITKPY